LGYGEGGLLTSKTDARENTHTYEYSADGRLISDSDPAGGSKTLERTGVFRDYSVSITTALDRSTTYDVSFANGGSERTITLPSGLATTEATDKAGSTTVTPPDGTVATSSIIPDSRFGLLSPTTSTVTALPSGLTQVSTVIDTTVLADPSD